MKVERQGEAMRPLMHDGREGKVQHCAVQVWWAGQGRGAQGK